MQAAMSHEQAPQGAEGEALTQACVDAVGTGGGLGAVAGCSDAECESLYAIGYGLYTQGRHADALQIFGLLVLLRSLEHRFVFSFAACLQVLGRHEEAINHYATALVIDTDDPAPLLHLTECLVALQRLEQAHDSLATLSTEYPSDEFPELAAKAARLLRLIEKEEVHLKGGKS
jgi:type III secretion system low calcium response chaperone LcrH/SycD